LTAQYDADRQKRDAQLQLAQLSVDNSGAGGKVGDDGLNTFIKALQLRKAIDAKHLLDIYDIA
jgi:hypothetical protein